MNEPITTERDTLDNDQLDPGAFVGHEPERQGDSIPGGVRPTDERVAAYAARPGVAGEPEDRDADLEALSGVDGEAVGVRRG